MDKIAPATTTYSGHIPFILGLSAFWRYCPPRVVPALGFPAGSVLSRHSTDWAGPDTQGLPAPCPLADSSPGETCKRNHTNDRYTFNRANNVGYPSASASVTLCGSDKAEPPENSHTSWRAAVAATATISRPPFHPCEMTR
jgi:hypothetical protein